MTTVARVTSKMRTLSPNTKNGQTPLHRKAIAGHCFEGITVNDWCLTAENNITVAHLAALAGTLPRDVLRNKSLMNLRDNNGATVAHYAAMAPTSAQYAAELKAYYRLADNQGWTVAHELANQGTLPQDFKQFDIDDEDGWTVAHELAEKGLLPANFNRWMLADRDGWTVAHQHVEEGHPLPENFRNWNKKDDMGETIEDVAFIHGALPYKRLVKYLMR